MTDDLEWRLAERRGLRLPKLHALTKALSSDLDPDAWGYSQFSDIENIERRAIVSDQLIASVNGVRTNLVELALSLAEYHCLTAAGFRMPRVDQWIDDFEDHLRAEMAQVAVFRAIGCALDCIAAVAILVLRIPRSPTLADVRDLNRLRRQAETHPEDSGAREVLTTAAGVFDQRLTEGLRWALEMRNAVIHRGRQIAFHLPRFDRGALHIVTTGPAELARERARADRYLHRRPWLPEMEHLADIRAGIAGQWINEPAQITMHALRDDLVDLIEHLSEGLHAAWSGPGAEGSLPAPGDKWKLREPPSINFVGYAPVPGHARPTATMG